MIYIGVPESKSRGSGLGLIGSAPKASPMPLHTLEYTAGSAVHICGEGLTGAIAL